MARGTSMDEATLIRMALVGYEAERLIIDERIREIQAILNGGRASGKDSKTVKSTSKKAASAQSAEGSPKRRTLSAAARKRIAQAQKKRWAEHRKALAAASQE